jgi:hypothetical protein
MRANQAPAASDSRDPGHPTRRSARDRRAMRCAEETGGTSSSPTASRIRTGSPTPVRTRPAGGEVCARTSCRAVGRTGSRPTGELLADSPARGHRQDRAPPVALEIGDHREIPVPLGDGLLVHARMRHDRRLAPGQPRRTARVLMPHASSQLMRSTRVAPVTEHSHSSSIASRSNSSVNCDPGSAHGKQLIEAALGLRTESTAGPTERGSGIAVRPPGMLVSAGRSRRLPLDTMVISTSTASSPTPATLRIGIGMHGTSSRGEAVDARPSPRTYIVEWALTSECSFASAATHSSTSSG